MKKILILAVIILILTMSVCTVALAAFQAEPKVMPYYGEKWHFDVEEKGYPYAISIPKDRKEPQVYGNGSVGRVDPKQKKYDIIWLNK